MSDLKLTDLIDVETLQNIQDTFSDMTGLASVTADENGIPVTKPSGFCEFCIDYTRENPLGRERCEMCDKMGAEITHNSGKPCTYLCHAGLVDFAAPIMAKGKIVGSFIGGQVLTNPPDLERTRAIAIELGIDPEEYVDAVQKVNILKKEQIDKAANFLCVLANNLSKIAFTNYHLHESNIKIEKAAKMKSDFLANMSHEIRTPMNAVLGMADLALREQMSPAAREYIHQIKVSGKNLLIIINDILDFSKIESGKMDIIEVEYEPLSIINDIASIINNRIGNKDVELIMDVSPDLPQKLWGDNVRIHQIMINLLTNAVKFTKQGMVKLTIRADKITPNLLQMYVSVSDTGMGIKKEDFEKIFSSFQQVDSKRNRNIEGTGLGLAISQQLLTLMNGKINVESEYGKGSTFTFELPQKIINPEPFTKKPENEISVAVMISNPYVKEQILKDLSWIDANVTDMQEDIDSIEYADSDYIIISKNFYEGKIYNYIKAHPEKHCMVIDKFNGTYDYALPNVKCLRCPVYSYNLYNAMGLTTVKLHNEHHESSNLTFIAPEAKILIVDDNHVNLVVAKGLLEPLKMNIDTALSAAEAISKVKDTAYDIIFMDHMMPEVDGVEATHIIRELVPGYASVPIIALSANAVGEASEMFIREGMNDFVPKPIEIKDIVSKLRKWLPEGKIVPVKNDSNEDNDNSENEEELVIEGLNVENAIKLLGSKSLFMSVLREYYLTISKKTKTIIDNKNSENWRNFTIEVHALKSTSKQVGADLVATLAAEMERAGNERNIDYIMENIDQLINEYTKYNDILKNVFPDVDKSDEAVEQKSADSDTISQMLDEMQAALDEFDTLLVDEVIEKMEKYQYDDKQTELLEKLKEASESTDIDKCSFIISEWKKNL